MSRDLYPAMMSQVHPATWNTFHNLANVNTSGFKERRTRLKLSLPMLSKVRYQGYTKVTEGKINMESGSLIQDNNPTSFALEGKGFFVVQSATGEPLLTRAGFSSWTEMGFLNAMGEKVMTVSGPIQFDEYQREN